MRLPPDMLLSAYAQGLFPMPDARGTIRWYRPDPRAVIPLDGFHVSRSLARTLRKGVFDVSYSRDFRGVMAGCANRPETWITKDFFEGYGELHRLGFAHSVEVWKDGVLVGGTYGVQLGGAFFAESKFHTVADASKVALAKLVERLSARGFTLLEVQFLTEHLQSLGAIEIPAREYTRRLANALQRSCRFG